MKKIKISKLTNVFPRYIFPLLSLDTISLEIIILPVRSARKNEFFRRENIVASLDQSLFDHIAVFAIEYRRV